MAKYTDHQPSTQLTKILKSDDAVVNLVNETAGALKVDIVQGNVTLNAQDIQIGAVEIKNATDDTRATVGANGLHVDVRASVLPTGAATEATLGLVKAKTDNLDVLLSTRATETTLGSRLADATFTGRIGEVQAIPTANTVLARLKDLLTGIVLAAGANRIGKVTVRNSADTADIDPPASGQLPAALTAGGNLKTAVQEPLPAGTNNIGDVDVLTEPATAADAAVSLPAVLKVIAGWSGAAVKALKTDAAGELQVDVLTIPNVTIGTALPAGNNNIGDVDVATLPALPAGNNNIGDVDVATLPATPAGTNRIGGAYAVSGQIIDENGAVLTVKRAFANVAASQTDSNIISAVTSKKLRILAVIFQCGSTATAITFNTKPAGAGSAISPQFQNGANGGAVLALNSYGWFETLSGEGLTVTTGAGSTTGVHVLYIEV